MKLTKEIGQQAEVRGTKQSTLHIQHSTPNQVRRVEWWETLPVEEKHLLRSVVRLLREAKADRSPEVAAAAAKWEPSLIYFIKVRLVGECRKVQAGLGNKIRKLKVHASQEAINREPRERRERVNESAGRMPAARWVAAGAPAVHACR